MSSEDEVVSTGWTAEHEGAQQPLPFLFKSSTKG